ncbi:MAG TPA: CerR family C-terminal domain-containing protein [Candidatus Paceibacterota bacterium]|nr:CerR family C-terminal domain-containing protein [Candidatus Paceibacterota bacterium]
MKRKPPVELKAVSHDETRRHLLEAAGQAFAEAGFRDATVREICRRAGANIAAINYHFGDKEMLYLEVLRHAHGKALEKYPPLLGVAADAPPEKKLRAFIHSLLLRIFDKSPTAWHGKVLLREMIEPTAALDSLVEERMRPMVGQLWKIVAEILDCPFNDERVRLCGFSIVSQCTFYKHCNPVVSRLFPDKLPQDAASIAHLAGHITDFSLAAMKHFSAAKR